MAITRPTLQEIRDRLVTSLIQSINSGQADTSKHIDPTIANSAIRGLVESMTASFDENYDSIEQLQTDLFPFSVEDSELLQRFAATYGLTQKAATIASGNATFTGVAGTVIPNNTSIRRSNGLEYITAAYSTISAQTLNITSLTRSGSIVTAITASDHNLASGTLITSITGAIETDYNVANVIITVTASNAFTYAIETTPTSPATGSPQVNFTTASVGINASIAGADYNAASGSELTLISSLSGVDTAAFVQFGGIIDGTNIESELELRARINERTANMAAPFTKAGLPPFIKENNTGITRVWVQRAIPAPGSTSIYFVRDNDVNIIPTAAQANQVKDSIINQETGILPANMSTSSLFVNPPTPISIDITFSSLTPNTIDMQSAITSSLTDYFRNNTNVDGDVLLDDIKRVISSTFDTAGNIPIYTLTSPVSDISIASNELGTLGTITYP